MIPNDEKLRKALLMQLYASANHCDVPKQIYKELAYTFRGDLENVDLEKFKESESRFANRVQWVRMHLVKENLILSLEDNKRNEWKLSEKGIKLGRELFLKDYKVDPWIEDEVIIESGNNDSIGKFELFNEELSFIEGKVKYVLHIKKERNKELVALKKRIAFDNNASLPCEICHLSFKEKYGDIGEGFIEAHHIRPISELTEETETKIDDLILLCANCHKIIHRKRPWLTVAEIKKLLITNYKLLIINDTHSI